MIKRPSSENGIRNKVFSPCLLQDLRVTCKAGFDGGHDPEFHLEAYEMDAMTLTKNVTRTGVPEFELHDLRPSSDYGILLYASNAIGKGLTLRLNVTTLEMAEKRTAERRSKVAAVEDGSAESSSSSSSSSSAVSELPGAKADPGLALLPVITILCGVAVGLATVALGIIFLVRGRGEDSANRNGGSSGSDGDDSAGNGGVPSTSMPTSTSSPGSKSRGKYGMVATEDDLVAEKQLRGGDEGEKRHLRVTLFA